MAIIRPSIQLLDEEHKQQIFNEAKKILEDIGIQIQNQEAIEIFNDNGLNHEGKQYFIPNELVGPKGNFLKNVHTLKHFRKELWFPNLLNREYYDSWRKKGATSMAERCRERKDKIITTHKPEPLKGDVARELEEIVDKAKLYLS